MRRPVTDRLAHPGTAVDGETLDSTPPPPLEEAIARGGLTPLQHAALEHTARRNRRSLSAEIRAALHPERF